MVKVLLPIEQLLQLNREAYTKLNDIEYPLIVVGGQAVSYWLAYYGNVEPQYQEAAYSVDIDYAAKLEDIKQINQVWKCLLDETSKHPPSLALLSLVDNISHEIKQKDGALFLDIDEYNENEVKKPNSVDVIDRPKGFSYEDINTPEGLALHTVPFKFPPTSNLESHEKLRILTPIACLKSRLANHQRPPIKPPPLERTRIRALMNPITYYIQDQLEEIGFRKTKKQINLLIELITSPESINLSVMHNIHLVEILSFFVDEEIAGLPREFIQKELVQKLKCIQKKIARHKMLLDKQR